MDFDLNEKEAKVVYFFNVEGFPTKIAIFAEK